MDRIRFHLDESVDPDIADGLRLQGLDVTTTPEAGLRTLSDRAQFEYARKNSRVLLTHDADFLRIASKEFDHPGIYYCRSHTRSIGEIILGCITLYNDLTASEMRGKVEYL